MKAHTLGILAAVAVVVVATAWIIASRGGSTPAPAGSREALAPSLGERGGQIARITLRSAREQAVLERRDGRWMLASKGGYPADDLAIRDMLRGIDAARIVEVKTSNPEFYGRLGVDDPDTPGSTAILVRVEDDSGDTIAALLVGKSESAGPGAGGMGADTGRFARRVGEAASLLVRGMPTIQVDPMRYIDRDIGSIANERVRSVTIDHAGRERVHISRATPEEQSFTLDGMPEGRSLKDQFALTRVAWAFAFMTLDDVAPATEIGVDVEGASVATFRTFDGLRVDIAMIQKDGETWATFRASAEPAEGESISEDVAGEVARLNARWGGWAYKIPDYKAIALRSTRDDLLAPAKDAPEALPGPVRVTPTRDAPDEDKPNAPE
jgi:hypothetical protein